jgi:prepilin-type N-terminal cleavage/methylation domain-containing protein
MKPVQTRSTRRGYTLVEVLVAAALGGIVIAGATGLMITGLRSYYAGRDKLQISQDIRSLTLDLMGTARNAADFKIYDNFANRTEQTLGNGRGDMVAFLYADPNDEARVVRVVTYYRDLGVANNPTARDQTLRRFDTGIIGSQPFNVALLPGPGTRTQNRAIVETTADATSTQPLLFQRIEFSNNAPRGLGVSGQIVYSNKALRRFQNTYDFVVSCRS